MSYLDINFSDISSEENNALLNFPYPFNFEIENKVFTYDEKYETINKEENYNNQIVKNIIKQEKKEDENTEFDSKKKSVPPEFLFNQESQNIINNINIYQNNNNYTKKKRGRKNKKAGETGKHNKFSDDNLIRRCKSILLKYLLKFINKTIQDAYQNNIGVGMNKMELLKMNKKQIVNSKAKYNQEFLYKQLKDIFSDKITTKFKHHSIDHNKKLIQHLLNEKDEEKLKIFEPLFKLTILECLNHFRGHKNIKVLEGMITLDEACQELKDKSESYIDEFKKYINNFEKIIMKKKSRNRRK